MSFSGGLIFTNRGRALQAKAQTGIQLNFTRLGVGDGELGGQAIEELLDLIQQVKSLDLNKFKTLPGGKAVVGGVLSNQQLVTGFYWRELGLFATDPDQGEILYCYGNAGALAEYIPAPEGAEILEKQVDVVSLIVNAANVSATIEQSLIYATQQDLLDLSAVVEAKETGAGAQAKADAAQAAAEATAAADATAKANAAQAAGEAAAGVVQENLNGHLADYKYQTPTIVAQQIQLERQSDTNRLLFYLSEDLTGGAITISLDDGATEVPLNDIDDVAVTSLDKGFVEVIDNTTFFTLRPRGVKITGQTEVNVTFAESINKNDPVYLVGTYAQENAYRVYDIGGLPTDTARAIVFSPDGNYMVVGSTHTPYILIYKRSGASFLKLANPTILPTGSPTQAHCISFSPDSVYMAVVTSSSPYLLIYKRTGDTFTKLTDPTGGVPSSYINGVDFSSDGTYLVASTVPTPYVFIYKRTGDTFAKLANVDPLPASAWPVAFSPDITHLAVVNGNPTVIYIYKRNGDAFAQVATLSLQYVGADIAYSPDSTYLAAVDGGASVKIFKRNGDSYAALSAPATLPTGAAYGVAFSSDGTYLAVAHNTSPYITVYKRTNDTFTKLADADVIPNGNGNGVEFSPDGTYMSIALNVSPYVAVYKGGLLTATKAYKSNNLASELNGIVGAGYALESGVLDDIKKVIKIWG